MLPNRSQNEVFCSCTTEDALFYLYFYIVVSSFALAVLICDQADPKSGV
jgi:hypothetical protein